MFQQLKHIDSAFRLVRSFCLLVIIICFAVCSFAIYKTAEVVKKSHEQLYILANGKILEATASSREENIPVEARDHIRMFHYYFFTLDPDEKVIQSNISKALYLADGSAKKAYDNLKENSYYANIISGNISQAINIDSIQVNTAKYPFYWKCYAIEKITRPSSIVFRNLVTEGYLRD